MTPQLVVVEWWDAWGDAHDSIGENDADPHHKAMLMQSLGWLLRDDETGISIFNERCIDKGDESYRGRTFIPRAMVHVVTPFKMSKPRKAKVHAIQETL